GGGGAGPPGAAARIRGLAPPSTRRAGAAPPAGARLLTGEEPASAVRIEAKLRAKVLIDAGVRPRLALVSVGDDPASQVYLKKKHEACAEAGIAGGRGQFAPGPPSDPGGRRGRQPGRGASGA